MELMFRPAASSDLQRPSCFPQIDDSASKINRKEKQRILVRTIYQESTKR